MSRLYARTVDQMRVNDINHPAPFARTAYRALDVGVARRQGGWGRFAVRYVWSASIAHSVFYADANSGVPDEWWNDWDRFERGPSDFHQPHRLVSDASIELPFATRLAIVATAASRLPVNSITGRDNNGDRWIPRVSCRSPRVSGSDRRARRLVGEHEAVHRDSCSLCKR